jgi:hypothetical protein
VLSAEMLSELRVRSPTARCAGSDASPDAFRVPHRWL